MAEYAENVSAYSAISACSAFYQVLHTATSASACVRPSDEIESRFARNHPPTDNRPTRGKSSMSLQTRQNPETGTLEVLVNEKWEVFEEYRKRQIDEAYQNSIRFLRDRLGEDAAKEATRTSEAESND
jgi:hypothetical protein